MFQQVIAVKENKMQMNKGKQKLWLQIGKFGKQA